MREDAAISPVLRSFVIVCVLYRQTAVISAEDYIGCGFEDYA